MARTSPERPAAAPAGPPPAKPARLQPGVIVSQRAAARLRAGHVWVYRSDVRSADEAAPGSLVSVLDEKGKVLGAALYSSASQIALRLLTRGHEPVELASLLHERILDAIAYRARVVTATDACRLVFSEGDALGGLIVDRYNDVIAVQFLTQAMDRAEVRDLIVTALRDHLAPAAILEHVDPRIRELEELPPRGSGLLYGEKTSTTFAMNGVRFQYNGLAGQKTGAFLDQRENYAAAERYAHGEALDVFCYQGGFALHLARACQTVTGVDSSRPALEVADQNAALNGREIEWIEGNAFDLLKDYSSAGRLYDTIVLDPPAFAKSQRMLETALRGYKELNLRALKMLRPGGVLVTCSCSHHVSETDFLDMLASAAVDAHRSLRIVEKRIQAKDHPILLTVPETAYLKCVIAEVAR